MRIEEYVKEMLRDSTVWERLKVRQYPPKDYVHLESKYDLLCCDLVHSFYVDMHKSENGCWVLLERTVGALDEEALQKLLVTTQHSNMLLCIKYCVQR